MAGEAGKGGGAADEDVKLSVLEDILKLLHYYYFF